MRKFNQIIFKKEKYDLILKIIIKKENLMKKFQII